MRILFFKLFFLTSSALLWAQDPVFTQFLLVPETLNPAVTGSASTWNAGIIHRRQWPEGNRKIDTQYGFVNNLLNDNLGLGLTILNQNEVFTNYNYLQVNGVISYSTELNYDWRIRFGLEGGYGRKDFNFNNLLLEDQIDINTGGIASNTVDPNIMLNKNKLQFFDLNAGIMLDQENCWIGATLKHLTRPDISFNENGNTPLDLFLSAHGGYYFTLNNSPRMLLPQDSDLLIAFNYMRQSKYNRLDISASLDMKQFGFGITAATNPERNSSSGHLLTSLNPFAVFKTEEFIFGYSYDINTSKFGHNQGIHELTITWQSSRTCRDCDNYRLKLKRIIW